MLTIGNYISTWSAEGRRIINITDRHTIYDRLILICDIRRELLIAEREVRAFQDEHDKRRQNSLHLVGDYDDLVRHMHYEVVTLRESLAAYEHDLDLQCSMVHFDTFLANTLARIRTWAIDAHFIMGSRNNHKTVRMINER